MQEKAKHLTASEVNVLKLASDGLTYREISKRLFVSRSTVATHMEHARTKLGVHNRSHAVRRAIDMGLLSDYAGGGH